MGILGGAQHDVPEGRLVVLEEPDCVAPQLCPPGQEGNEHCKELGLGVSLLFTACTQGLLQASGDGGPQCGPDFRRREHGPDCPCCGKGVVNPITGALFEDFVQNCTAEAARRLKTTIPRYFLNGLCNCFPLCNTFKKAKR